MNYEEMWKALSDLATELRKKGKEIPVHIVNELRSAKTIIQILKADPSYIENIQRVETYLGKVESYLILMAQEIFGSKFVERWMKKLEEARKKEVVGKAEITPEFVAGAPRSKGWVRIQILKDTPRKGIEQLVTESKLSSKMQKNGYMLVYGNDESIKCFIKKLRIQQIL